MYGEKLKAYKRKHMLVKICYNTQLHNRSLGMMDDHLSKQSLPEFFQSDCGNNNKMLHW